MLLFEGVSYRATEAVAYRSHHNTNNSVFTFVVPPLKEICWWIKFSNALDLIDFSYNKMPWI